MPEPGWNKEAVERLRFYEGGWRLPEGTVDAMLASVAGVRDAEFILLGIAAACHDPREWRAWLHRSEDPNLHAAARVLGDRLEARQG